MTVLSMFESPMGIANKVKRPMKKMRNTIGVTQNEILDLGSF